MANKIWKNRSESDSFSSYGPSTLSTYVSRLDLPEPEGTRMLAIIARAARTMKAHRSEWYNAKFEGQSHLRIFFGKLIVLTIEGQYIWLALDENSIGDRAGNLASLKWDTPDGRPADAKGKAYPRYARPPSRNAFYDPEKDPDGREWLALERSHGFYLKKIVEYGLPPDIRTRSDAGLKEEIDTWACDGSTNLLFDLAVEQARGLSFRQRQDLLQDAPKKPKVREVRTWAFDRSPYVVVEVLERAGGKCEICLSPAPFVRASDGTPYLEVHHLVRLADGGDDTVENAVALCPNCHRRQHFG